MADFARSGAYFFLLLFAALPSLATAQPVLAVSPTTVTAQGYVGTNPSSQSVQVRNTGKRALKWSVIGPTANWLVVSPKSGTNSGNLALSFQTSSLPAGVYSTAFAVQSSTGSSISVIVGVQIDAPTALPPPPPPTLVLTCPANKTVASSDGSAVVVTYSATTSGGEAPITVVGNPASGYAFPVGTTPVTVTASSKDGQTKTCGFSVTVTDTPTTGDWTYCATEGGTCIFSGTKDVRYGANGLYAYRTLTDGTACTNGVFGDPVSGTVKQCWVGGTATAPPPPPPPPTPTGVGPQSTITCPAGAVDIWPGTSINSSIGAYGGATTFCLRAGVHYLTTSITPKTGNTFIGEYGAVLDGSNWRTTDGTAGAFRAHNEDIDYVTIRNLVIRRMPNAGIHTFWWMADHWTIEYNEVAYNKWGINFSPDFVVRNNYIHHNAGDPSSPDPNMRGGGYQGASAHRTLIEGNEIAYNGPEQKIGAADNVTFRNNFIHHNIGDGVWYDGDCRNAIVEGNRIEDNGRNGIFYEISSGLVAQNNAVRRNGGGAIFISTSQNAQIYNNTLEGNFGSILYFLNCAAMGSGFDLTNNTARDNAITIGTQNGTWATGFSHTGCTSSQIWPYMNGSKNLIFARNAYRVNSLSYTWYFLWNDRMNTFSEWQGLGKDTDGSIAQ